MFWTVVVLVLQYLTKCGLLGLYTKAVSRRSFLIILMHASSRTTKRLSECATITIRVSSSLSTVYCRSAVTLRNSRYFVLISFNQTSHFLQAGWPDALPVAQCGGINCNYLYHKQCSDAANFSIASIILFDN